MKRLIAFFLLLTASAFAQVSTRPLEINPNGSTSSSGPSSTFWTVESNQDAIATALAGESVTGLNLVSPIVTGSTNFTGSLNGNYTRIGTTTEAASSVTTFSGSTVTANIGNTSATFASGTVAAQSQATADRLLGTGTLTVSTSGSAVTTDAAQTLTNKTASGLTLTTSATFAGFAPAITSSDRSIYYPTAEFSYSGLTPKGRVQYQWSATSFDNPDSLHSVIALNINTGMLGPTSDNGDQTRVQLHLEHMYDGGAVTTVTSSTTAAGVTTFTVASTSNFVAGRGMRVRGHSISALNAGWTVATVPSGTTFTATTTASANGQVGTGGDLRSTCSEEVLSANTHRARYTFVNAYSPGRDCGTEYYTPLSVITGTNMSRGPHLLLSGYESSSSYNAGVVFQLRNTHSSSANSQLYFSNPLTGGTDLYVNFDPNKNGTGNFQITHANVNVLAGVASGNRIIYGGALSADNGTDKHQVLGGTLYTGTAGNIVREGATADANETTFTVTDPTADRTISAPDASGVMAVYLTASTTWDPGNLADGAVEATTLSVTGATVGQTVLAAISTSGTFNIQITGHVQAADTVRVVLQNVSGGAVDLSSGTLRAQVIQH